LADRGQPARGGGPVHAVLAPDLVDAHAEHEVAPQHVSLPRTEPAERVRERVAKGIPVALPHEIELGVVGRRDEDVELVEPAPSGCASSRWIASRIATTSSQPARLP